MDSACYNSQSPSSHQHPAWQQTISLSRSANHVTLPVYSQPLDLILPAHSLPYSQPTLLPTIMAGPSELEQMQRLSEAYNPDLPGPLVGNKLPMLNLVTEYSQADAAFVQKTQSLAATHSGYRQIKGDGQCGWRGAVFGYFETLLSIGDLQLAVQEEIRLQSFADLMRMAGIDYDIIVDMFDHTWELFADLKSALERGQRDDKVLTVPMNDEVRSNSIVYHFKMMTSAFMQLYPGNYEPFLEMSIADYRVSRIDPSNQEIDQIGLQVMTDAVIAPAGFALDVYYLDRSMGDEVTPHEFAPKNVGGPKIGMLYRPGHYDLVYAGNQSVQVYIQNGSMLSGDVELSDISGLSGFSSDVQAHILPRARSWMEGSVSHDSSFGSPTSTYPPQSYQSLDEGSYMAPQPFQDASPHSSVPYSHSQRRQSSTISSSSPRTISSASRSPTSGGPPQVSTLQTLPLLSPAPVEAQPDTGPRIRPTKYVMEYRRVADSVPLLSAASGAAASHCPAHFRNEEFQPQMWNAEEEYMK